MNSLNKYVEAILDVSSAESEFKKELSELLEIPEENIDKIKLMCDSNDTKIRQYLQIRLVGVNRLKSEKVAQITGLTIITPKTLEVDCGEIPLWIVI